VRISAATPLLLLLLLQVQVLCEVLEREWAVVYYWSETQGSHMTLVHRDRDYFNLLWRVSGQGGG
jgi:hypothetical protein